MFAEHFIVEEIDGFKVNLQPGRFFEKHQRAYKHTNIPLKAQVVSSVTDDAENEKKAFKILAEEILSLRTKLISEGRNIQKFDKLVRITCSEHALCSNFSLFVNANQ